MQDFAQVPSCLFMPCHTKHVATIFRVVLMSASPWIASKTTQRQERGTTGRATPVEMSHSRLIFAPEIGRSTRASWVIAVRYTWTPASTCWACAMLQRSRSWGVASMHTGFSQISTRETASASALFWISTCRTSVVYSDMMARCHCCLRVQRSELLAKANVCGL